MINIIVGVIVGTVQNIRVEAVRIENVLILDSEYHHTSAYLVCELVALVSFLSVSFTLISSMSYAILVLFFSV